MMKGYYLITGGAGFIGTNLSEYYLSRNMRVTIFDNFSRAGTEKNVEYLKKRYGDLLTIVRGDVKQDYKKLLELVENCDVVFHQAAQVAVTLSVTDPREDFEINALGTLNVLEAVRLSSTKPILVYSSTNKVYGKMEDVAIVENNGRYKYASLSMGVPETRSLDFYSPYGCSKGAGDQYMIDYARIYGLKTIVFRQSCIYGPHQFGIEDQGWVAWFTIQAMRDSPVTIYGDGKQVRDILYIDDLIGAYNAAIDCIEKTSGQVFNMGGGPGNTLSLLELIDFLEKHFGLRLSYTFDEWRPGDQPVYISDIRKAKEYLNWEPKVGVQDGIKKLSQWIRTNEHLFRNL